MASTLRFDNWENSNGDLIGTAANGYLGVPGTVLQVVSTTKTDAFSTTSATPTDITGLSVSITPSSTTSKVLVIVSMAAANSAAAGNLVQMVRDSTVIGSSTAGSTVNGFWSGDLYTFGYTGAVAVPITGTVLDSPSTTSAVTYKVQVQTASGTLYVNRRAANDYYGQASTITVMEIAG